MIARTDLAVELQEDKNWEIPMEGIRMKTRVDTEHHIKETKIVIENEAGSRQLGKPVGTYITLECHDLQENDFSYHYTATQSCLRIKNNFPSMKFDASSYKQFLIQSSDIPYDESDFVLPIHLLTNSNNQ